MKVGKKRVLVVDDTRQILRVMERLLQSQGLSVDVTDNGREAIEMFFYAGQSGMPYDLVILDYEMPELDGLAVLGELKKIDRTVKAILHSGASKSEVVENYLQYGFASYIGKPVDAEVILRTVASTLG